MKALALLTTVLPLSLLIGQTSTWNVDADGDWGVAANWTPATVPNAQGDEAIFSNKITAMRTVTLMTVSPTVGNVTFTNTAQQYQIVPAASNELTFSVSSGSATISLDNLVTAPQLISTPITLTSNVAISQGSTSSLTLSGVISGGGGVTVTGSGTVILSGASTFSGGLTVGGSGIVQCGAAGVLPPAGNVTMSGGALELNGFAQTIGGLSGTTGVQLNGGVTLTVATTGTTSYGGKISIASGSVVVNGIGNLTLTNNNLYEGGTTISGGTLQLGITNGLSSAGSVTVTSPGVFNLSNFSQQITLLSGNGSVMLGSGTLTLGSGSSGIYSGVISGSGSVVQTGSMTQTFSGTNT